MSARDSGYGGSCASTSGILRLAREIDKKEFIIGTEEGLGYRLKKENPGKEFYFAYEHMVCQDMKKDNTAQPKKCTS